MYVRTPTYCGFLIVFPRHPVSAWAAPQRDIDAGRESVVQVAAPVDFVGSDIPPRRPVPNLGEHTEEISEDLTSVGSDVKSHGTADPRSPCYVGMMEGGTEGYLPKYTAPAVHTSRKATGGLPDHKTHFDPRILRSGP